MASNTVSMTFQGSEQLNRAVQRLADISGKGVREVLTANMRLFAADLAFNTRPKGKGADGQREAQKRVEARVYAVYITMPGAIGIIKAKDVPAAEAFRRAVKNAKYTQAAAILNRFATGTERYSVGDFDDGELHKRQRFTRRVSHRLVVIYPAKIRTYAQKQMKLVGFAKGGFATAARQLGGVRGIPGYATRQNSPGQGTVTGNGAQLTVTLQNDVRYIAEALDRAGEETAIMHRKRAIELVIRRIIERRMAQISNIISS